MIAIPPYEIDHMPTHVRTRLPAYMHTRIRVSNIAARIASCMALAIPYIMYRI